MLRVEKNLSPNSISAYKGDLNRYLYFLSNEQSLIDLDDNELYDIGFSAINRMDGLLIAKKVHSWNDW